MSDPGSDPELQPWFDDLPQPTDEGFTQRCVTGARARWRRYVGWRLSLMLTLALVSDPLTDAALLLAGALSVQLFAIDSSLAAQLLAPINTVGGLLSLLLLTLRILYKRLFR